MLARELLSYLCRLAWLIVLLLAPAAVVAHPEHDAPETESLPMQPMLVDTTCAGIVEGKRVVMQTGFELGEDLPSAPNHRVVSDKARTAQRSLLGQVDGTNQALFVEIPMDGQPGKRWTISFFACSDNRSACNVAVRIGQQRTHLFRFPAVPTNWAPVQVSCDSVAGGVLQIATPSSYGAPPGRVWIDDLAVIEETVPGWPESVESFPVLAADSLDRLWLAVLERPLAQRRIGVYRVENGVKTAVCSLSVPGLTGIGSPAIAAYGAGCVVVFPFERQNAWKIAYAFVGDQTPSTPQCRVLKTYGTANISPSVAVSGSRAWIVWESNSGGARRIYTCSVDATTQKSTQQLSRSGNSYNPSIVALPGGSLYAAWDSVRNDNGDIYGAWRRNGKWELEQRLTSDARIERHPHLAARGKQVWMAWQAQSYQGLQVNAPNEQRIAVARLDTGALLAPKDFFASVSDAGTLLVRPRIGFDSAGRLWLTARRSIEIKAGWKPMFWVYSGQAWCPPQSLREAQGRWQPVNLAFASGNGWAAVQFDDLPITWAQRGIFSDWHSAVAVLSLPAGPSATPLETEPLQMPPTAFSLAAKREFTGAAFPRQQINHAGQTLNLYWGDFHEHTDLSVCVRAHNPPGHDLFANLRDIERLDFAALTDHDYNFDRPQWDYNGEQTRNNQDNGRFVTFLGHEWTSSQNPPAEQGMANRYGHRNLIFLDPYYPQFFDSYDGDISPSDLWQQIGAAPFLCIPHQLADWQGQGKGNPPTDWSYFDEVLQPVAEIFQNRGSYEYLGCPRQAPNGAPFPGYYLQDAWAQQVIIGVIASPDHGGGYGKVGVWAPRLRRDDIFNAVRARHTFGASGAKMSLFVRSGAAMMGDKVTRPSGPISFDIIAKAPRNIGEVVIFRNNQIVHQSQPGVTDIGLEWTDSSPPDEELLWYYARIQTEDGELAWSSPIWFVRP